MDVGTAAVVAALVSALAGVIIAAVNHQGNKSSKEHNKSMITLDRIENKVDNLGTKVDGHLGWHDGVDSK